MDFNRKTSPPGSCRQINWQPNAKAMPLGTLANHVAAIPARYLTFATNGEHRCCNINIACPTKSKDEILNNFNSSCSKAKEILNTADASWENKSGTLQKMIQLFSRYPLPYSSGYW